jgi:hypothetical protein
MTNTTRTATVLLGLAPFLVGCGVSDSALAPLAPSAVAQPVPVPAPITLAVFTDPASGFSTSDVRDVHNQIIHFNTANELIWTADDTRFRGYRVAGDQIKGPNVDDYFQIRFGTKDGERRAYLGWSDDYCHCPGYTPSVIDVEVVAGQLMFAATNVPVPEGETQ